MHKLRADGKLAPKLEKLFYKPRPEEELYDLRKDPWEMRNLAGDAAHEKKLAEMRSILERWIETTGDKGQAFETAEAYGADMAVYMRGREDEQKEILRRNIADTEAWRKNRTGK